MQCNQHGGCAMMAMGQFSSKVSKTGVDPYKLGRWCWMKVGSGDKTTWIVMAYQPSGSNLSTSVGTMVREQNERYFEAWGDLRPVRKIFLAIDCPDCHLETNGFRYHFTWWLQWERLLRVHCKTFIAPGPIVNQTMLAMCRITYTPNL